MTQLNSLASIPEGTNIITGIDVTGNIKKLFETPSQMPGCLFLLCIRGKCKILIHLTRYDLKKDSIATIYPNQFVQITEYTPDCRFAFIGFSSKLLQHPFLFPDTAQYIPFILECPVIRLNSKVANIFYNYFKVLIKGMDMGHVFVKDEQIPLIYSQLLIELGNIYRENLPTAPQNNTRSQEIVKELVRIIVKNYKKERSISFYADKMHLSPQHLSTTVKKATGKTLTEIISVFVIKDAQAKLKLTEQTIQEIAYSLNFPDISFFGKYFKRYTGMSPKQYRNNNDL